MYSTIHSDVDLDDQSSERAPLSAKAALEQTTQILSSTTKTTKAMLSTVADTKWWQSTIKTLKQPTKRQVSETVVYENDTFQKQGCHPFYEDFISPGHPDVVNKVLYHCTKNSKNRHCTLHPSVHLSDYALRKKAQLLLDRLEFTWYIYMT